MNCKRTEKIKCYYCGGNHNCRNCQIEKNLAGTMKQIVGKIMENIVAKYINCQYCNTKSLKVLGNNTPSLDIVCSNCNNINIECKSKCLSVEGKLPNDLYLNHGNYNEYLKRQEKGLDWIIIIYKVLRKDKIISIRKILYVKNNNIKDNNKNFSIVKKHNSHSSSIFIKNHNLLEEIKLDKSYNFSFKTIYNKLLLNLKKLINN
uniref:Uncharacterized protein n=1 Tax=viral metagenome TaxID=1070528 RepID=A0A6C0J3P3_9ZZZZ